MAARGTLNRIAQEHGESLETLIPRLLREHKTVVKVAAHLDVYPHTIQNWLKRNGYHKQAHVTWVKNPNGETAQQ